MAKTKNIWAKGEKKKNYISTFVWAKGDKVFQLIPVNGEGQTYTFNSWQAAKKDGWKKLS